MSDENKSGIGRRKALSMVAVCAAALPLAKLRLANAADRVDEAEQLAQQLGYKHDATTVDTAKFPKRAGAEGADQLCNGCQFFHGDASAEWSPCTVFGGKEVNGNGWCNSWFKKAG